MQLDKEKGLYLPPSRQTVYLPGLVGLVAIPAIVAVVAGRMTLQFPKWLNTGGHDALLDYIAASNRMDAISAYTAGDSRATVVGNSLADVTMAGGDFTKAAGDTNGRKVTVAAKSGITIDASGTATHVSLVDASIVRLVTTCTSQALTAAGTVNFPAWKHEVADPT